MRRKLAVALAVILISLSVISHLLHSSALLSAIATNPDGSSCRPPCAFGIELGKTTLRDGLTLIKAHPYTRQNFDRADATWDSKSPQFKGVSPDFDLAFRADTNTITTVSIGKLVPPWMLLRRASTAPSNEMPTLSQMISSFGSPSTLYVHFPCESAVPTSVVVSFYYPESHLQFFIQYATLNEAIKPEDRPYQIVIWAYSR